MLRNKRSSAAAASVASGGRWREGVRRSAIACADGCGDPSRRVLTACGRCAGEESGEFSRRETSCVRSSQVAGRTTEDATVLRSGCGQVFGALLPAWAGAEKAASAAPPGPPRAAQAGSADPARALSVPVRRRPRGTTPPYPSARFARHAGACATMAARRGGRVGSRLPVSCRRAPAEACKRRTAPGRGAGNHGAPRCSKALHRRTFRTVTSGVAGRWRPEACHRARGGDGSRLPPSEHPS
jgi:hypothetical protein